MHVVYFMKTRLASFLNLISLPLSSYNLPTFLFTRDLISTHCFSFGVNCILCLSDSNDTYIFLFGPRSTVFTMTRRGDENSWKPPSAPVLKALRGFRGRSGRKLKFSLGTNIHICRRGAKLPGERGTWCFGIASDTGISGFFPEACVSAEDLFEYDLAIKQAFVEYKNYNRLRRQKSKPDEGLLHECLGNIARGCV